MKISFIVPVKSKSSRVPGKNTRPFADTTLLDIKLKTLVELNLTDEIIVSSDSDDILQKAGKYKNVVAHKRDDYYCRDETPYSEVCKHIIEQAHYDIIYWVHITTPLISAETYRNAWAEFSQMDKEKFDSIIGMKKLQTHIWTKDSKPLNYTTEKHVYSQFLEPLYIINNSLFITPKDVALKRQFNYGFKPKIFEVPEKESIDIDHEDEFEFAEFLYRKINQKNG